MSRATMDSARIAGALVGASLSATLGVGRAYIFVASFYAASLALTFGVSRERYVPDPGSSDDVSQRASYSVPRPSNRRDLMDWHDDYLFAMSHRNPLQIRRFGQRFVRVDGCADV